MIIVINITGVHYSTIAVSTPPYGLLPPSTPLHRGPIVVIIIIFQLHYQQNYGWVEKLKRRDPLYVFLLSPCITGTVTISNAVITIIIITTTVFITIIITIMVNKSRFYEPSMDYHPSLKLASLYTLATENRETTLKDYFSCSYTFNKSTLNTYYHVWKT